MLTELSIQGFSFFSTLVGVTRGSSEECLVIQNQRLV